MRDMRNDLHRIFVYGTLMRGESNHRLIASQELEGEGFIRGFNLYNLGYYPGIRPSKHPEHKQCMRSGEGEKESTIHDGDIIVKFVNGLSVKND